MVTTPMMASTTAIRARIAAISRVRREKPLSRVRRTPLVRGLEDIAGSTQGMDHRRPARIDLLAEVRNVELHDVRLAAEIVVPDPVEDLSLAQHPARVAHQVSQELELGGGQRDRLSTAPDLVAVLVHDEVADH